MKIKQRKRFYLYDAPIIVSVNETGVTWFPGSGRGRTGNSHLMGPKFLPRTMERFWRWAGWTIAL